METFLDALKSSSAEVFIMTFPKGINEQVLERGKTLSAGQWQLISLARTIVHDPSIFISDEATSNIDTYTEKLIQKAIEIVQFTKCLTLKFTPIPSATCLHASMSSLGMRSTTEKTTFGIYFLHLAAKSSTPSYAVSPKLDRHNV